jgi:hypothetical protein
LHYPACCADINFVSCAGVNTRLRSADMIVVSAGTVLDAPAAAVYQLSKDGQVVGLAVSSEAATD